MRLSSGEQCAFASTRANDNVEKTGIVIDAHRESSSSFIVVPVDIVVGVVDVVVVIAADTHAMRPMHPHLVRLCISY